MVHKCNSRIVRSCCIIFSFLILYTKKKKTNTYYPSRAEAIKIKKYTSLLMANDGVNGVITMFLTWKLILILMRNSDSTFINGTRELSFLC